MIDENQLSGRGIVLRDRCAFRFTGPDRVRYLNGQISTDVSKDLELRAVAACVCTIKGKVEALVWVSSDGESLILDGELSHREALHERLDRYLIADDCEIQDVTETLQLHHHFIPELGTVSSKRTPFHGFDRWVAKEEHVPDTDCDLPETLFALAQMQALIPRQGVEITANEFPAELGLDKWAVDFHKGCYLGQEIVSRIESVGRVKKRLRLLQSQEYLPADTKIRNSLGESGKISGQMLLDKENNYYSLGVFSTKGGRSETLENQPLRFDLLDEP
ncbi:MAG: hypothetical protein AAGA96_17965 [Verrucomicrobiota bacterium]